MKKLVLVSLLLIGCGDPPPLIRPSPQPTPSDPTPAPLSVAQALLDAHNSERKKNNLSPLTLNTKLQTAAVAHTRWMATNGQMNHTGVNGSSPFDRMKTAGYNFSFAGENIAWNQRSVAEVMRDWMNSPGHRANILGAHYTEVGFAKIIGKNGDPYWTTDFARPTTGFQGETKFRVAKETSDSNASSIQAVPEVEQP